ncbi:unnamed protein product, partial [Prorocentrum cordatum]
SQPLYSWGRRRSRAIRRPSCASPARCSSSASAAVPPARLPKRLSGRTRRPPRSRAASPCRRRSARAGPPPAAGRPRGRRGRRLRPAAGAAARRGAAAWRPSTPATSRARHPLRTAARRAPRRAARTG